MTLSKIRHFFCISLTVFLTTACDLDFFDGDDESEEVHCSEVIDTAPVFFVALDDENEYGIGVNRNNGSPVFLIEKRNGVRYVNIDVEVIDADEDIIQHNYIGIFNTTTVFPTETLREITDENGDEYWILDELGFPATNLSINYTASFSCSSDEISPVSTLEIPTPDICEIHHLWRLNYNVIGNSGNFGKNETSAVWKGSFVPTNSGDTYTMAYIPYENIGFRIHVSSRNFLEGSTDHLNYNFTFDDFLEDFRIPNNPGEPLYPYINEITLNLDFHKLTGITAEQWENWPQYEVVVVEGEIFFCNEAFNHYPYEENSHFTLFFWNRNF